MFVWKQWKIQKQAFGVTSNEKTYKILLLFGIIPLFIFVDGYTKQVR